MTDLYDDLDRRLAEDGERWRAGLPQVDLAPSPEIDLNARPHNRSRIVVSAVAVAATVAVAIGLAAWLADGDAPQQKESPSAAAPVAPHLPSPVELDRAVALVRAKVASEEASITDATVFARAGRISYNNTGEPCTSGRLLDIVIIGRFAHILTTGRGRVPGSRSIDSTPTALEITADAATGEPCELGVLVGKVRPAAGTLSVYLDGQYVSAPEETSGRTGTVTGLLPVCFGPVQNLWPTGTVGVYRGDRLIHAQTFASPDYDDRTFTLSLPAGGYELRTHEASIPVEVYEDTMTRADFKEVKCL